MLCHQVGKRVSERLCGYFSCGKATGELVQNLGNGYDRILMIVTDLMVDLKSRLGIRAEDRGLIAVGFQNDGDLH